MSAGLTPTVPLFRSSSSCCPSNCLKTIVQAGLKTRSINTNQSCPSLNVAQ